MQLEKSKLIRNLLKSKGFTPKELAQRTGLSLELVSMALNGKRLSLETLKKFGEVLEFDLTIFYSDIEI